MFLISRWQEIANSSKIHNHFKWSFFFSSFSPVSLMFMITLNEHDARVRCQETVWHADSSNSFFCHFSNLKMLCSNKAQPVSLKPVLHASCRLWFHKTNIEWLQNCFFIFSVHYEENKMRNFLSSTSIYTPVYYAVQLQI